MPQRRRRVPRCVEEKGIIEGGTFHESVYNERSEAGAGTIAGGTFTDYVNNARTGTISGGTFNRCV